MVNVSFNLFINNIQEKNYSIFIKINANVVKNYLWYLLFQ